MRQVKKVVQIIKAFGMFCILALAASFYRRKLVNSRPRLCSAGSYAGSPWWREKRHKKFDPIINEQLFDREGVYVFDFHPVQLLFDVPDLDFYLKRRTAFLNEEDVGTLRYSGYGCASYFGELLDKMRMNGINSQRISDIVPQIDKASE